MCRTQKFKILLLSLFIAASASALSAPADADNILLTNDDGYGSYGIGAMQDALEAAGHTVYVSAPASQQSGKSGSLTADFGAIIDFTEEVPGQEWSVDGTPADSVSAGLFGLTPDVLPPGEAIDLVVSGVNDGENVSRFTNASGTVGAAMWGLRRGVPSIAVSAGQDIQSLREIGDCPPGDFGCIFYWLGVAEANAEAAADAAAAYTVSVIDELGGGAGIPEGYGLSINVPSGAFVVQGAKVTRTDNAQGFDLVIAKNGDGDLEVDAFVINPIIAGLLAGQVPLYQCPFLPLDFDSEGSAFACANITIAIVDGNIDATQDTTDQAKDLACSLEALADPPSFFNCDGGDGPKNENK